jgi:phosphoserine phosphatase
VAGAAGERCAPARGPQRRGRPGWDQARRVRSGRHADPAVLDRLDIHCALSTITFDFAAQYVAGRFGFGRVAATALEWSDDGEATGNVAAALEDSDKCCFLQRLCDDLGISVAQALFVGDARSDIPAINMAGWSVGFNPTPAVEDLASASVHHSTDLRDLLPEIRHLLRDRL